MIEASLHQLELHQREIGGDHYPYGLQLMFNSLSAAIHYSNPAALLNLEPALARLRTKASTPGFIRSGNAFAAQQCPSCALQLAPRPLYQLGKQKAGRGAVGHCNNA